jgi:hypothetical protein
MPTTQLKVIMSVTGEAVAETEGRPLHLALEGAQVGQIDGRSQMPFGQRDLAIILRALELNHSVRASFTPQELVRLQAWGVLAKDLEIQDQAWIVLEESDIHVDKLLTMVQQRLYHTLFPDEKQRNALHAALASLGPREALHLRLELPAGGAGEVANVQLFQYPWEVLSYAGDFWKGRRATFSRFIRHGFPVSQPKPVGKLNVLVVTARPHDLPIGPGDDKETIKAGLKEALAGDQVSVLELPQATTEALSDHLFDHQGEPDSPHVLHFDGHGEFGRRCPAGHFTVDAETSHCPSAGCGKGLPDTFSGYLAFEHPDGGTHWVSALELVDLLRDHDLSLVVLNACKSGLGRRGEDVFNGMAQSLIRSVPAVVATPFRLDWEAALRFAHYFYQDLGQGKRLVEVMDRSRQRLRGLAGLSREWYRPVLYLRHGDDEGGLLFVLRPPQPPEPPPKPEQATKPESPLIYMHNFGDLPGDVSLEAIKIDWSHHFDRARVPRRVPDTKIWQEELLPELRQCQTGIGRRGLIRLQGSGALSTGFALGQTFSQVGRYWLEVTQLSQGSLQTWRSNQGPPSGHPGSQFASQVFAGNPAARDGVVIVHALTGQPLEAVVAGVGAYWGEQETFRAFLGGPDARAAYNPVAVRQLLIEGFSAEELRILCFDHSGFRPVYEELSEAAGKAAIAQRLVAFAEKQVLFEELLALLRERNPRRYELHEAGLKTAGAQSHKLKGVLLLEAEAASREGRELEGWEAAELARTSRRLLKGFVDQINPERLHLFLAVPYTLAVFLGHQWNAIGKPAQCYEWVGGDDGYAPSCLLDLS